MGSSDELPGERVRTYLCGVKNCRATGGPLAFSLARSTIRILTSIKQMSVTSARKTTAQEEEEFKRYAAAGRKMLDLQASANAFAHFSLARPEANRSTLIGGADNGHAA
ncbi:hypothetical protein D9M72_218030 [compost metagenome]